MAAYSYGIGAARRKMKQRSFKSLPGAAEQGAQGEQLLLQIHRWGSSIPPTAHRHNFVYMYTEQAKNIIYACCEELTVNANLLHSESAQTQSRQQSFLQHEQPF